MRLKSSYWVDDFRKAFEVYLGKVHPNWNKKTIITYASDAFFFFRQYSEEEAWSVLLNSASNKEMLRQEIEDLLVQRKNTKRDATGYLRAIEELQDFINLVHLLEEARKLKPREVQLELPL